MFQTTGFVASGRRKEHPNLVLIWEIRAKMNREQFETKCNSFFEQFAKEVDPNVHVVMFWDQAGFHTANKLRPPPNLTLIPLPPYCPELNPIENLWHYLRSHHWSNHAYRDYNDLRHEACQAWQASCLDPTLIQSVCRCQYAYEREVKM